MKHTSRTGLFRRIVRRALLIVGAIHALVVGVLLTGDHLAKRRRQHRAGFPRPGTFQSDVAGNDVTVYTYGEDLYRDMLAAIKGARSRVLLETYLWKSDRVGEEFRAALNDAAARGVEVFVSYDVFGNLVVKPSFYRFHPAVNVFRFPPLHPSLVLSPVRAAGLTHRKLLVVDDEIAFVGGYNIGSLYATEWRDTHVRLQGSAAFELTHAFARVWNSWAPKRLPRVTTASRPSWQAPIRAINNIPSDIVYPIRAVYLDAISRAQSHIYLTTAYFIPDRQILDELIEAARRGVDVRIIVPEESNHIIADWLSRGFYTTLLRASITLLLYRGAMVHAKTATIDGRWAVVGTPNIDRLSLAFNYETILEVQDDTFAQHLEQIFEIDSANCRPVTAKAWAKRHPAARFAESVLVPLRPFL